MSENATRFSLTYSSPIFNRSIIKKIGTKGQSEDVQGLINSNIPIITENLEVNQFLLLLFQLSPQPINSFIDLQ